MDPWNPLDDEFGAFEAADRDEEEARYVWEERHPRPFLKPEVTTDQELTKEEIAELESVSPEEADWLVEEYRRG